MVIPLTTRLSNVKFVPVQNSANSSGGVVSAPVRAVLAIPTQLLPS